MSRRLLAGKRTRSVAMTIAAVALIAAAAGTWVATRADAAATAITKVVWIWEENSNPAQLLGSCATCLEMPYLNSLANTYGRAKNVRAASVPSLPNYIAATSGSTHGIADDAVPQKHPLTGPSLFSQLPAGQAKVFAESMTSNCQTSDGAKTDIGGAGFYVVRHTAWPYYTDSRTTCKQHQVPLGGNLQAAIASGLPAFSEIVPANCNNLHKGGSPDVCVFGPGQTYKTRADAWLRTYVPMLMSGPDWQAGRLAIFIAWDEGSGSAPVYGADCTTSTLTGCKIPLVVVSPGTSGVADPTPYTTYSILRTTEDLLGLPRLGRAATANSFAAAFGLTGSGTPPTTTSSSTPGGTDTTAPSGSITAPASGATVGGSISIAVTASDNVGVTKVNLLVDGVFVASDLTAPFSFQLNTGNYANGSHSLSAKVYDAAGNRTLTSSVPIIVSN